MTEWIKNICMTPLKFGAEKVNFIATKAIMAIFNLYGRRLLKMDIDKIIKHTENREDRDEFYLYPLTLREIEQPAGPNLFKIEEGLVNGLVISVPWKAILAEPTVITIDSVELTLSNCQNINNVHFSILEQNYSYFENNENVLRENDNLVSTYREIYGILLEYFNKINFNIGNLKVKLTTGIILKFTNITYQDNILSIKNIVAENISAQLLAKIDNVSYAYNDKNLIINEIFIDPNIIDNLPVFFTDDAESTLNLNIVVNKLIIDDVQLEEIELNISPEIIFIKQMAKIHIQDILFFTNNKNLPLLIYNTKNGIADCKTCLDIKISALPKIIGWIKKFKQNFNKLKTHFIAVTKGADKEIMILDLKTNIFINDDLFNFSFNKINIYKTTHLLDAKLNYSGIEYLSTNIIIDTNGDANMMDVSIAPKRELIKSQHIIPNLFTINTKNIFIKKKINNLDISFINANVYNIVAIVEFVTQMVEKLSSVEEPPPQANQEPLIITLNAINSAIKMDYIPKNMDANIRNKICFDFLINNLNICINRKEAANIDGCILVNEYLVAKFNDGFFSPKNIGVKTLKISLDPEMFDQLNYFAGTLTPTPEEIEYEPEQNISPEGLAELQRALSQSFHVNNLTELEKEINEVVAVSNKNAAPYGEIEPIRQSMISHLAKSFIDLRAALIEEYDIPEPTPAESEMLFSIETLQIYLFDRLVSNKNTNQTFTPFACMVLKNILFKKNMIPVIEQNPAMIRITEKGVLKKPDEMTHYSVKINTGAVLDNLSQNSEWKYFLKFSQYKMVELDLLTHGDVYKINIQVNPFVANIREETLMRILSFFSNQHKLPNNNNNPVFIENFRINNIDAVLNYQPMFLQKIGSTSDALSLKNYRIILAPVNLYSVAGFDKLATIIGDKWIREINPTNVLQFVPNIKAVQPYINPVMEMINITKRYFQNRRNKQRLRDITRKINASTNFITQLVTSGINHIYDLFV